MAPVLGKQIAWKQIDGRTAGFAVQHLHPQERLHGHVRVPVARTQGPVVATDLGTQCGDQRAGSALVSCQVERLEFLADDPGGHRVDVESFDVASDAVRLDERRSASHERIGDSQSGEIVRSKEKVLQATLTELREHETTKQGAGTAGEPFVDTDERAVVLLNLLLPERHRGDQRDVEATFDAHNCLP